MRLTVFGATGPSGLLVVERALREGHHVTAYARDASRIATVHDRLQVVEGSLTDEALAGAVEGADAVVSLLGPKKRHRGTPITDGTARIVDAMDRHGVRRLVAVATPSAPDERDRFDPRVVPMVMLVRFLLRDAYRDIVGTADVVRRSPLDWTLLRVPFLTEGPAGPVRLGYPGLRGDRLGLRLARASLAGELLRCASDAALLRSAPMVSNA